MIAQLIRTHLSIHCTFPIETFMLQASSLSLLEPLLTQTGLMPLHRTIWPSIF